MTYFSYFWQQTTTVFTSLLTSLTWRDVLDITMVAFIIYQIIKLVRQTRANTVLKGLGVILAFMWLSDVLQLNVLNWMLVEVVNKGVIMLVIIFQPEFRRGLEQIGRSNLASGIFSSMDKRQLNAEHDAKELVTAMTNLARRKVGALIVIEGRTGLKDIIASGTVIDAEISAALVENIFEPNTPLHDGAMVTKEGRLVAAACFLPLSESSSISRELGTRHRAALGISETTDAVVLIVSEETGIISVARDGRLSRYLDAKSLYALLMKLFIPDLPPVKRALFGEKRRKGERRERQS